MTENRDEPTLIPKQTDTKRIIEHVENSRMCLMREALGIGSELKQTKETFTFIKYELKNIQKVLSYFLIFNIILMLCLFLFTYELYEIMNKLTSLGL